ncbi:hypothetical protein SAMN00790413_06651 [Deinococcus hopiensis KR-140]|uniref:Uncharacterized protein n=2 Tax=Deinococcus TaxID=1298 RepID=A0A1W1UBG8_9DEIO|nr:hypothetical protein SAMN00790413_06651 [Deinococcus hopiensis KR-140]
MGVSCAPTQVSSVTSIKTTPAKAGTELEDGKKRLWEKLDAATRQLVIHLEEDDKKNMIYRAELGDEDHSYFVLSWFDAKTSSLIHTSCVVK